MNALLNAEWLTSRPERRLVGVFEDPVVAKASAAVVRDNEPAMSVRTFRRGVKAGGVEVTVWVVVVVGRKSG